MNNNNIPETNGVGLNNSKDRADDDRRDFLRKSLYVAYATPVIMSLLAEKANAATSWGNKTGSTVIPPPPKP